MEDRSFQEADYRYGFNGMEKNPSGELGSTESYTTLFRQYNPVIGRWLSIDPVFHPWQSPYSSFDNSPISLGDPNGDCTKCDQEDLNNAGVKSHLVSDEAWAASEANPIRGGSYARDPIRRNYELGGGNGGGRINWGGRLEGSNKLSYAKEHSQQYMKETMKMTYGIPASLGIPFAQQFAAGFIGGESAKIGERGLSVA